MTRVLILGITSWIGFRLAERLRDEPYRWQVAGTSRTVKPVPGLEADLHEVVDPAAFGRVLGDIQPAVVINLLRGEDAAGLAIHSTVLEWCARHGALYAYASSALALDGYVGVPLTEDLPARSVTPYGQFKQACEAQLQSQTDCRHLILRFASIQGWVPHKPTRNEAFLRKLASGQDVVVDRGVVQNRILDRTLASAVVDLMAGGATGVVHFGAVDASEEYEFLRSVATDFGLDLAKVKSGARRDVNLAVQPRRLYDLFGDRYRVTEAQAVRALLDYEGLRRCAGLAPVSPACAKTP
jgi:dTDP-4-dehydrorhamnose reductase